MTEKSKKLKWEQVIDCFDLKATNTQEINVKKLKEFLQNVKRNYPDYKKPFSKKASGLFERWFREPERPLHGSAYGLLSNWFLTSSPASKTTRAKHALDLWRALFCAMPERRLTSSKRNDKILKEEFNFWWPKQQKCQEVC